MTAKAHKILFSRFYASANLLLFRMPVIPERKPESIRIPPLKKDAAQKEAKSESVIRKKTKETMSRKTKEETVEVENVNNFELLQNRMFLNSFLRHMDILKFWIGSLGYMLSWLFCNFSIMKNVAIFSYSSY